MKQELWISETEDGTKYTYFGGKESSVRLWQATIFLVIAPISLFIAYLISEKLLYLTKSVGVTLTSFAITTVIVAFLLIKYFNKKHLNVEESITLKDSEIITAEGLSIPFSEIRSITTNKIKNGAVKETGIKTTEKVYANLFDGRNLAINSVRVTQNVASRINHDISTRI